jgi:thioesterase III
LSHRFTKKVRGFHCDSYGHVNNARYLEFLEEARWDALESKNIISKLSARNLLFFVVNVNISFKKPVLPLETIEVKTRLGESKRKTLSFLQSVYVEDKITTQAEVTFVLYDSTAKQAVTLTPELLEYFKTFE